MSWRTAMQEKQTEEPGHIKHLQGRYRQSQRAAKQTQQSKEPDQELGDKSDKQTHVLKSIKANQRATARIGRRF